MSTIKRHKHVLRQLAPTLRSATPRHATPSRRVGQVPVCYHARASHAQWSPVTVIILLSLFLLASSLSPPRFYPRGAFSAHEATPSDWNP